MFTTKRRAEMDIEKSMQSKEVELPASFTKCGCREPVSQITRSYWVAWQLIGRCLTSRLAQSELYQHQCATCCVYHSRSCLYSGIVSLSCSSNVLCVHHSRSNLYLGVVAAMSYVYTIVYHICIL